MRLLACFWFVNSPEHLPFGLGIGLKWLVFSGRVGMPGSSSRVPFVLQITGLLLPSVLWLVFVERASQFRHWVWFTGFELVMGLAFVPAMLMSARPRPIGGTLDRASVWVGQRSFGLYLWHFPIILAVYGRGPFVLPPRGDFIVLRLFAVAALSIFAAHVSWVAIERPAQDAARRLTAPRKLPV
jgi:peptidoglycan/LPS O-acetylase OafA/YrhL